METDISRRDGTRNDWGRLVLQDGNIQRVGSSRRRAALKNALRALGVWVCIFGLIR